MAENFWKSKQVDKRANIPNSVLDYNPKFPGRGKEITPVLSSAVRDRENKMVARPVDPPKVVARKVK